MIKYIIRTLKSFSLLILLLHLALTFFYSMPINPIKIGLNPLLNMTIGTFFPQNWSLFAPSPVTSNNYLCILPLKNYEDINSPRLKSSSDWINLTLPLLNNFHENRFSAYERISRVQLNSIRLYVGASPELYPWSRACNNGDTLACIVRREIIEENKELAKNFFLKIGSSFCNLYQNQGIKYFALKIISDDPTPWSERYSNLPKSFTSELISVFKVDTSIVPSTFYNIESL